MAAARKKKAAIPQHPGLLLRSTLTDLAMSQAALSRASGLTQKHISRIITGQSGIGTEAAYALERTLGVPAMMWIRMQAEYDVAHHKRRAR